MKRSWELNHPFFLNIMIMTEFMDSFFANFFLWKKRREIAMYLICRFLNNTRNFITVQSDC